MKKPIKAQVIPFIENIQKSLASLIYLIKNSDMYYYNTEEMTQYSIEKEREFGVFFHKHFKQYVIHMRDNVVFIYPKTCLLATKSFPCVISRYR